MTSIYDLLCKLPVIMNVAVGCQAKLPMLPSFRDTTHSLQMVYYWLREADNDMKSFGGSVELSTDTAPASIMTAPTLIDMNDRMDYIHEKTDELAKMTLMFISDSALPPKVEYKLKQGYSKIMEAMFNNEISKTYYDEYTKLKSTGQS